MNLLQMMMGIQRGTLFPQAPDIYQSVSDFTRGIIGKHAGTNRKAGQSFTTCGSVCILDQISVWFAASEGSPTGQATIRIEADDGDKPSGTLVDPSLTITFTPTVSAENIFNFTNTALPPYTKFWIVILSVDVQSDYVYWQVQTGLNNPYPGGRFLNWTGTAWVPLDTDDMKFKVVFAAGTVSNLPIGWLSYYPETMTSSERDLRGDGASCVVVGQALNLPACTITGVKFYANKVGSPAGNAVARIYACTGTPGTDGKPTGSVLATSDNRDVSAFLTHTAIQLETFTFSTPYVHAGGNICIEIYYANGNSSNYIMAWLDSSTSGDPGNLYDKDAVGNYTAYSGGDAIYYLLGKGFKNAKYPPAFNGTYVKATSQLDDPNYGAYHAVDPYRSLIGGRPTNSWLTDQKTNQRFHVDLGASYIITELYIENQHNASDTPTEGAKNFTLQMSNSATAFADLDYSHNTDWDNKTCDQSVFLEHPEVNAPYSQKITITNTGAYRYMAIKIADNWGSVNYLGLRRVEFRA